MTQQRLTSNIIHSLKTLTMPYTSYRLGITPVLVCSLLWQGCQSRLPMNEEDHGVPTAKTMVEASAQTPPSSVSLTSTSTGKRSASELSQPDAEQKQESPVAVAWQQPLTDTREFSRSVAHASEESGIASTVASSRDLAGTTLAKTPPQDAPQTAHADQQAEGHKAPQATSVELKNWFQRFADAVDGVGEEAEDEDSSEWLSYLVREGRQAGYLAQSVPIAINTVGWEPNCTPLHYAAAKGNEQAVAALLREPSVIIEAKTEDQYESTPLHFAAFEGNLDVAQLLVQEYKKQGKLGEIDAHDKEGSSPLQYAASGPWDGMNQGVAELLVDNGADLKQCLAGTDLTLLDVSALSGNIMVVRYLIGKMVHTGLFTEEEKKKLVESAMRLAKLQKYTDIVITLKGYYERMCAHYESIEKSPQA
jgi:Ankyrin repeats (3 copies)